MIRLKITAKHVHTEGSITTSGMLLALLPGVWAYFYSIQSMWVECQLQWARCSVILIQMRQVAAPVLTELPLVEETGSTCL